VATTAPLGFEIKVSVASCPLQTDPVPMVPGRLISAGVFSFCFVRRSLALLL
jgi:hypothetical protein